MFCIKCDILRRTNTKAFSKWALWNKWYSTSAELAFKGIGDLPAARGTFKHGFNRINFIEFIDSFLGLPFIGTTLSQIMAGSYPKLHRYIDKRHKRLGPVFKESIGPVPCVFVSDPEAMRLVFANEGKVCLTIFRIFRKLYTQVRDFLKFKSQLINICRQIPSTFASGSVDHVQYAAQRIQGTVFHERAGVVAFQEDTESALIERGLDLVR